MKNVMAWAKTNWMIVALTAVAIVALPALWVVSMMMNASLRESHQKRIDSLMQPLLAPSVTYSITTPEGAKVDEVNVEPTVPTTEWYSRQWGKLKGDMDKVGGAAETFNKADHKVLVGDLFPKPSASRDVFARGELAAKFVRDHASDGPLLASVNAGGPASVEQLAEALSEFDRNKREQYRNEQNSEQVDEATLKQWADEMRQMRIGHYQLRARQIALYADRTSFPELFQGSLEQMSRNPNAQAEPALAKCWDYQEQYWIHQDILAAIKKANEGGDGGVEDSVIKRILMIDVEFIHYSDAIEPQQGAAPVAPPPPAVDPAMGGGMGMMGPDFTVGAGGITGRQGGARTGNFYDVRKVVVTVIADAERLPVFFDTLAATNFMTVTDVDLKSVDTAGDLKNGYYYGAERVVEAKLEIETIWLRSWRVPLMPQGVKNALEIPAEQPAAPPVDPAPQG